MRYLKLFEAKKDKKDWGKMVLDLESEFRNLIKLNTDITLDHIKDISASALDIFRDQEIQYDCFFDTGNGEYIFISREDGSFDVDEYGEPDKVDYKDAIKFYKKLATKKNILLNYEVRLFIKNGIPLNDPKIISIKEEIEDIKSRCQGEGVGFKVDYHMSAKVTIDGREIQDVRSISLHFIVKVDTSKIVYDYRKILNPDSIADFDKFVSMYKIPKDGEKELVTLISNASKKKKKKKD
jgi:hypothetical protein